jgi:hypothetical protein
MKKVPWLLLAIAAFHPATLPARSVFEAGSATAWRYLDGGQEPDAAWQEAAFDDSQWKSGRAPLGYGDPGLGTEISWGADGERKPVTTWFRRAFDAPELEPGERLVIACCVDDGAALFLNGREVGRINLPDGPLNAKATATRALSDADEGFYRRLSVPAEALQPGRNELAVEVHQASPASSDLFFDLALKIVPADAPTPAVAAEAQTAVETFRYQHYLGPDVRIPDGYMDGGRAMNLGTDVHPSSGREILLVDRANDEELARHLAFARAPDLQALPPIERARRLADYVDRAATPPGGMRWTEKTCDQMGGEYVSKTVRLGDWLDQGHAGMCRHRSLLFKVLADEAGLQTALVRGNYDNAQGAHAWNELFPGEGRRLIVDLMLARDRRDYPEVTAPEVASHYRKPDNTRWYGAVVGLLPGRPDPKAPPTEPIIHWLEVRREPRPLRVHVVRADLRASRIALDAAIAADPDGQGPAEAQLADPLELARRPGTLVAINANAFATTHRPPTNESPRWVKGLPVDIRGVARAGPGPASAPQAGCANFWVDRAGQPHVGEAAPPPDAAMAVSGFSQLVRSGLELPQTNAAVHPRSAIGCDRSGETLWLVLADGRQAGISEGMAQGELAALMKDLGCWDALNLDGGGSSVLLVDADQGGGLRTMNHPSDGRPRPIPVMLVIRSQPPSSQGM